MTTRTESNNGCVQHTKNSDCDTRTSAVRKGAKRETHMIKKNNRPRKKQPANPSALPMKGKRGRTRVSNIVEESVDIVGVPMNVTVLRATAAQLTRMTHVIAKPRDRTVTVWNYDADTRKSGGSRRSTHHQHGVKHKRVSACDNRTKADRLTAKREKQKIRHNIRSMKKRLAQTVVAPISSNNLSNSSSHDQRLTSVTRRRTGHADEAGGNCKRRSQCHDAGASHSTACALDK